MRETFEFRIPEPQAARLLPADVGERSKSVRVVRAAIGDPILDRLRHADDELRAQGRALLLGWRVLRDYDEHELEEAELLQLEITKTFEPAGEECGTMYDGVVTCERCGAGRRRLSPLRLDPRSLPAKKDLAQTIAGDEWIISERLVALLREAGASGIEFSNIMPPGKRDTRISGWQEFAVCSTRLSVDPRTLSGIHPLNLDQRGEYRCDGHLVGLNLIGELYLRRADWDGSDFALTKQFFGVRRGLVVPRPLMVISRKIWRLLSGVGATGWRVGRANLVG